MHLEQNQELVDFQIETLKQIEYYSVLNHISKFCLTQRGKELISNSFPTDDYEYLHLEHNLIEEAKEILVSDDEIPLINMEDIRESIQKTTIQNAILQANELLEILDLMRLARQVKSYMKVRTDKYKHLNMLINEIHENRIIEKHISDAIDDTATIKDNATSELARVRREIYEKSARLRSRLQKILKKVSEEELIREDFFTLREGRFVLPVKSEHKRHLQGIIHGVSQTGATVYVEPSEIIEMNNELSLLRNEEEREMLRILQNLTAEIGYEAHDILATVEIISHLDAVVAKAKYALDFGGSKPVIWDDNEIFLRNVKHPILAQTKGLKHVIPLSIDFTEDKRGHLISGPNAGGKTVALKSIGLNVAMALSGIFPLGECKTNYRTIFSAIGDNQSIENNLSTFSSQMLQMKRILDLCGKESLVLIDEICSGTDPQEGSALAEGILDTFIEINLFFIATTHQSSLKTYALTRDVIENASLEFNDSELKPTYKFLQGIPGNSYAFVLAKNIGFSKLVLNRAESYLGDKQKELEESIEILQKYRMEALTNRTKAEAEKVKYEKLIKDYTQRNSELKLKRKEILQSAQQEAVGIVNSANSLIENTIKQIKEDKKAVAEIKEEFKQGKTKIEKTLKNSQKDDKEKSTKKETIVVGDSVSMPDNPTVGTVIDIYEESNEALVEFGGLKFKIGVEQLTKKAGAKPKKSSSMEYAKFDAVTRIDIRGYRAEEALRELDEFISDAILNNVEYLTIVHGKGTGALKIAVHDYLKYHPSIADFRLGELVEGGEGVTILRIKD